MTTLNRVPQQLRLEAATELTEVVLSGGETWELVRDLVLWHQTYCLSGLENAVSIEYHGHPDDPDSYTVEAWLVRQGIVIRSLSSDYDELLWDDDLGAFIIALRGDGVESDDHETRALDEGVRLVNLIVERMEPAAETVAKAAGILRQALTLL